MSRRRTVRKRMMQVPTQAQPQGRSLTDVVNALTAQQSAFPMAMLPRDPRDRVPFGPVNPLVPAPLDPARPDTGRPEPRVYEYPVAWNVPGNETRLIPWQVLRQASQNVDILRRCIEIRKRHVRSLKWAWTVTDETVQAAYRADPRKGVDDLEAQLREKWQPEIDRLVAFWTKPWKSNGLAIGQWLNGLQEEHLVLDAVAVYPRTTYGGDLLDLEVLDGSTVKPLLDWRGARPLPPFPAFQQNIYGFPRGEFTATVDEDGELDNGYLADQLYYHRENFRTHSPYGYSAVEQALISARLYLRRQGWMLSEYDDGVTPAMLLVPDPTGETLTVRQRRDYEQALNDELTGQTPARHRAKVLFPGMQPHLMPSTDERYKPEYDLYLIKLLASHFNVTLAELGFTEAKGLGSSGWHEGQADVQARTGVRPDSVVYADIINELARQFLGAPPELEFQFLDPDQENEENKDKVADMRLKRGAITLNEDRRRLGLPLFAFAEADMPMVVTQTGPVFIEGASEPEPVPVLAVPGQPGAPQPGQPGGQKPAGKPPQGKAAGPDKATGQAVFDQLSQDYPDSVLGWVAGAHWTGPMLVPLSKIDFDDDDTWSATNDKKRVNRFVEQIEAEGATKPAVLVREPDDKRYLVIDGHHRTLAYQQLGQPVLAYVGVVGSSDGPWKQMHSSQHAGSVTPVSAPPAMLDSAAAKAAEARAYKRWASRPHDREFEFAHHSLQEQALLKAGGVGRSGNGSSTVARENAAYGAVANAEQSTDGSVAQSARVENADRAHGVVGKSSPGLGASALGNHVGVVDPGCADEQVLRPNTGRIVAGVADVHSSGHGPVGEFVSYAVSGNGDLVVTIPKNAVAATVGVESAGPDPAVGGTVHLGPESSGEDFPGHGVSLPKAGVPKVRDARHWPGWDKDLAAAEHWTQAFSQALTGAVPSRRLASDWLAVRSAEVDVADARAWLDSQHLDLANALRPALHGIWTDGYVIGVASAHALLRVKKSAAGITVDWGNWVPGDVLAAEKWLTDAGLRDGLVALLSQEYGVLQAIAATRMDDIAAVLARGLREGASPDRLAGMLTALVADRAQAYRVAVTETTRAISAATLDRYRANGVAAKEWLNAADQRVCAICEVNGDQGPVPVEGTFEDGSYGPPGHVLCRCALAPSSLPAELSGQDVSVRGIPEAPAAELAARARQAVIDEARVIANGAASILEDIGNMRYGMPDITDEDLAVLQRRISLELRNAAKEIADAWRAAADTRNWDLLAAAVDKTTRDAALTRIGTVGDRVPMDLKAHKPIGDPIGRGETVEILRPGYDFRLGDETVRLFKADVDEAAELSQSSVTGAGSVEERVAAAAQRLSDPISGFASIADLVDELAAQGVSRDDVYDALLSLDADGKANVIQAENRAGLTARDKKDPLIIGDVEQYYVHIKRPGIGF